ncbi:MAG TPA: class I SAM-dependent methyltransferase, partial [Edaphobacter sp.]|nr:class I SAM-dependent methyltransferase [Edaphobacter sp.]
YRGFVRNAATAMSQRAEYPSPSLEVAEEVRDFYDRYPYPRPIDSLEGYRLLWQNQQRRRADYHLFWPGRSYREDYSILIAGCGTSQAAKHALRWPEAQVTGIDISATSVRCTEELKRKYNLTNLQVHKLPIDRLNDLETTFDQIVCTGVLHHLVDPDAGLAALRSVLNPDGAMHLMVYAPYGRTGIYMLQEFCRRIGIRATDEGIRDLIAALRALPRGHPLETLLREAPDFRQEAALADALLHPQDRAYSVPRLIDFIERGRLAFGRWVKQAPYIPRCGVMAQIPHASRMTQLPLAEQYAAVELFRGTMVRHSVVVYRNDRSTASQPISFVGDAWLSYVPIRMPETICVQERLPTGAAAVLINQNHTYTDLYLAISSIEKRFFDAIDGNRTIVDILNKTMPSSQALSQRDMARTFFERLWWHDQVVFDTSASKVGWPRVVPNH